MWPFRAPPRPHVPGLFVKANELRDALGLCLCGKQRYAVVNSAALVHLATIARDGLAKRYDITRWHPTATCTLFANEFVSVANGLYFGASWHDESPAMALAAAELWFQPDNQSEQHAIGLAWTELGPRTIDPQRPEVLRPLSTSELATVSLQKFL